VIVDSASSSRVGGHTPKWQFSPHISSSWNNFQCHSILPLEEIFGLFFMNKNNYIHILPSIGYQCRS
jgi:hypothetical protein